MVIGEFVFDKFLNEGLFDIDKTRLEENWNEQHNNWRDVNYKKVPVGFEINKYFKKSELSIRSEQRDGVAFLNVRGTGIIAYDVGIGKTMTAILAAADFLAKGMCKRILFNVPKSTLKK